MRAIDVNGGIVSSVESRGQAAVWERLWRHHSSPSRDDAILDREANSARWAQMEEWIGAALGEMDGLRTVELGCGRGDLSLLLARRGANATLVDSCPQALRQATERFGRYEMGARFENADLFRFAHTEGGRFDVAHSSGVIEHFQGKDRVRAVRAHYDVLRPGGLAIISVPHARCWPYRVWKAYLELRGWWPYGFERPFTRGELTRCAREAGLEQPETRCFGFWQSVGVHWWQRIVGRRPEWADRASRCDRWMGFTLLLFGRRPAV
jgi:2-polyprenyl-3-methyl-5-hydroxy-6-metoxy-1,4-benzoquinol methylase